MKYCPRCQTQQDDAYTFCMTCGTPLKPLAQPRPIPDPPAAETEKAGTEATAEAAAPEKAGTEKKRRSPAAFMIAAAVLLILSLALNVCLSLFLNRATEEKGQLSDSYRTLEARHFHLQNGQELLQKEYDAAFATLNGLLDEKHTLQMTVESLQSENSQLKKDYGILQTNYTGLKIDYNILISNYGKHEDYYRFFEQYARVVPDDGSGLYHRYSCSKLDRSAPFWICNEHHAPELGAPCPDCCAND